MGDKGNTTGFLYQDRPFAYSQGVHPGTTLKHWAEEIGGLIELVSALKSIFLF